MPLGRKFEKYTNDRKQFSKNLNNVSNKHVQHSPIDLSRDIDTLKLPLMEVADYFNEFFVSLANIKQKSLMYI